MNNMIDFLMRRIMIAILLLTGYSMIHPTTKITLNSPKVCGYFEAKGYTIPTERYHRGTNRVGKNMGYRTRYILGTELEIKVSDLTDGSHYRINYTCDECGKEGSTLYNLYVKRVNNDKDHCHECSSRKNGKLNGNRSGHKGGKHYWKLKLLKDPLARCDLSGCGDSRFLVVHHLTPRSQGGSDELDNLVVLTANYHTAFHRWVGGNGGEASPELYLEFKRQELQGQESNSTTIGETNNGL